MTVDIYGHLIPSSNRQAVNALDENAPKRTPSAPSKNEEAVTHQDHSSLSSVVAMQGITPTSAGIQPDHLTKSANYPLSQSLFLFNSALAKST
jgi:hypothetical protein